MPASFILILLLNECFLWACTQHWHKQNKKNVQITLLSTQKCIKHWYDILTHLSPISVLFHTHLVFITLPVNRCVDCLLVLLTLWNSAVKYKTLWMQMLTDEYLTWLFIKHGNAQRSGAGEGESLSVSTERTAGRWQAATGPAKDSLHWSRAANNVMCAENVQPMAACD